MAQLREAREGDHVDVISGDHEGRSGILTQLRQISMPWKDPEWYGVIAYEETAHDDSNPEGRKYTDHIVVPVRRLRPR